MCYSKKSKSKTGMQGGQSFIEYALLLALIAIAAVIAFTMLEPQIGNVFSQINFSLGMDAEGTVSRNSAEPIDEKVDEGEDESSTTEATRLTELIILLKGVIVLLIIIPIIALILGLVGKAFNKDL